MAVLLSPVGGVAAQFFTNAGVPLSGGKIYTYAAGTSTPQATYTTGAGNIQHSNPIVLDAAGRVPTGEIWLTDGLSYKFVLKDSNDVLIATYDNIVGINSNFVNFTNRQQIETATSGQTVFNLDIEYQPGTNSLSVFVDGVNQYGPGAQYAYTETDSNTVTFTNGLHVGAEVKFTTSQLNTSAAPDASQVSYTYPAPNAVAETVEERLAQYVSVKDFGAVGDGVTDDIQAIQNAIDALGTSGGCVNFPAGDYVISDELVIVNNGVYLLGEGSIATKIISSSATANIITIGDGVTQVNSVFIEKMRLDRSIQYTGNAAGIYIDYAAHVKIIDVDSHESVYGYYFTHTNNLKIQRCKYVTQTYHATAGDSVYGWYFHSTTAKPNASAETRDCEAIFLNYAGTSYGGYIYGDNIKDAFLDAFETAYATYGMWIESTNAIGTADFDIHLHRNIHDSFKNEGIVIKNLFNSGSVSIVGGWTGPLDTSAIQNIRVEDSRGVVINGMIIFGGANYADNIGVYLKSSSTCVINGCTFTGNRTSIKIEDEGLHSISGNSFGNYFGQTADKHITCINTYRNAITGNTIDGPMNYGIYLDANCDSNSVYGNSINPDSVVTAEIENLGAITNSIVGADNDRGLGKIWAAVTAGGGTPSLISGYYVTSVTRSGTGQYHVNFARNLPNPNYTVIANVLSATVSNVYVKPENYTTSGFDINCYVGGVLADVAQINFVVFAPNS